MICPSCGHRVGVPDTGSITLVLKTLANEHSSSCPHQITSKSFAWAQCGMTLHLRPELKPQDYNLPEGPHTVQANNVLPLHEANRLDKAPPEHYAILLNTDKGEHKWYPLIMFYYPPLHTDPSLR